MHANNTIKIGDREYNRHVLIEVTKICNLRCLHCFTDGGNLPENELSESNWETVLNDLIQHGFNAFTISGGEPLLKQDKVLAMIDIIKKTHKKIKIYLFTNGLLFNKDNIKLFKKSISGVGISIDGNKNTHDWLRNRVGSYLLAVKTLNLLKKENIPVFIQCMATPQTLPFLEEVVKLAVNNNVKVLRFSQVDYFGRGKINQETIGLKEDNQVMLLDKIIQDIKSKYKDVYITSNLVYRNDLEKHKDEFLIPNLHILPNGTVLPWYGLPEKYVLWKYPQTTLATISKESIDYQIEKFKDLLMKAIKIALRKETSVVMLDNIVAEVLKS